MATAWSVIIREATRHANAFASGNASTVAASYAVSPLTTTQVEDPFFSLAFIQDKCIDAYGRLALEIANVRAHPWRVYVGNSATNTLASGDALPSTAANSKTIVGAWGQVLAGGVLMSEAAPERVRDYRLNTTTLYSQPYLYYIDGGYIYHTVATTVTINCCTYERSDTATAALAGTTAIGLPDVLVDAIVAGAVAELVVEAKGMEQGGYFSALFQKAIDSIRQGQTTMPMMQLKITA